jgi:hypothetical protein
MRAGKKPPALVVIFGDEHSYPWHEFTRAQRMSLPRVPLAARTVPRLSGYTGTAAHRPLL